MAYMNQQKKAVIASKVKPILKKFGLKGSLSVNNHSTIVLTLKSGKIDFGKSVCQVNHYWIQDHYAGKAATALQELKKAMLAADWYDRSDAMVDYFDTAYYIDINIGKWNKPYTLEA
jgi:ABC-type proline/glycine betaine transport system substrate-binding protein